MGRIWLCPIKLGIVCAVLIGVASSIGAIISQDYLSYHLYFTTFWILASSIDWAATATIPAACFLWWSVLLGKQISGVRKWVYRVVVFPAALLSVMILTGSMHLVWNIHPRVLKRLFSPVFQVSDAIGTSADEFAAEVSSVFSQVGLQTMVSECWWQVISASMLCLGGGLLLIRSALHGRAGQLASTVGSSERMGMRPEIRRRSPSMSPAVRVSVLSILTTAFLIVFAGTNVIAGALWARNTRSLKRKPNVVLIMVDSLRADHLGCYGYGRNTTPNLDRLAKESIRFNYAIAQAPWTLWSVGSLMASRHPQALRLGKIAYPRGLDSSVPTLAEALRDQGYSTNSIVSNWYIGSKLGCNQGFDFLDERACSMKSTAPVILSSAVQRLEEIRNNKFFMFLLFISPHVPYTKRNGFDFDPSYDGTMRDEALLNTSSLQHKKYSEAERRHMIALYDSEIAYTDYHIGQFLNELKDKGVYDDSLIIVFADHGEEFYEHGYCVHSRRLYNEVLHVPLIVKLPNQKKGIQVGKQFGLINVFPSVMHLLKADNPNLPLRGYPADFADVNSLPMRYVFSATNVSGRRRSVIYHPYKFIGNLSTGEEELYNLEQDPGEHKNLVDTDLAVAADLRKVLADHEAKVMKNTIESALPVKQTTEREKARLRALGYMH